MKTEKKKVEENIRPEDTSFTDFTENYDEDEMDEKTDKGIHKAGRAKKPDSRLGTFEHSLRIQINRMVKECGENGIPIFTAYYGEHEGWVYNAIFPEEVGLKKEYGKFNKFLAIVIGWDKEEALRQVSVRND